MSFDREIDNIRTRERNDQHGDLKNSAHYLYKNYKMWWKMNRGTQPLSFKEWINWAKRQGLVKNYNSDGTPTDPGKITYGIQSETKLKTEEVKNTGRTIAKVIIGISVIMIGLSFFKFGSSEQGAEVPATV